MALFDTTAFRIASQGLSLLTKQQAVIAQNIANQDTPDYKCKYLYFSAVLREKLEEMSKETVFSTGFEEDVGFERNSDEPYYEFDARPRIELDGRKIELAAAIHTDKTTADQPDGNNVDADTQEALFAKNALQYEALINQINSEFTMMRTAMRKS
ncbi:MAG: flagellar basal body rod protein FlgB [Ruminiclostridium sp.]|nr:flagellar basal body rod protein FlgB [Ruminiclostridium sp.]